MDLAQAAKSSYMLQFQVGRRNPHSRGQETMAPQPPHSSPCPQAPRITHVPTPRSRRDPRPRPHTAAHVPRQAPALPEASLVAGGAASMETFFLRQPAGVVNPGAMTRDDVDWYRAAMLKPGAQAGGWARGFELHGRERSVPHLPDAP